MASPFKGYLLKATKTGIEFPSKFIQWESYDSSPKQREEIKAYRDENSRDLHRITAEGKKTKITFTIKPGLHLFQKIVVQNWFTDAESDHAQRKIHLIYWDDENNTYDEGDFYRPDINFKIRKITEDDVIYQALEIKLVEY